MRALSLRLAALCLALTGLSQGGAAQPAQVIPRFVEETRSAGIDSVYAGGWQYMVGGGVATFDCNDDGFPVGSAAPASSDDRIALARAKTPSPTPASRATAIP